MSTLYWFFVVVHKTICVWLDHICKKYVLKSISDDLRCVSRENPNVVYIHGVEFMTVVRKYFKFTYFNMFHQQYTNIYLDSHHFSNSRFQTHSHGMIWSKLLCDLCFAAFKSKRSGETHKHFMEINIQQTDYAKISGRCVLFECGLWS